MRTLILLILTTGQLGAVELQIQFGAIQRALVQTMFTEDGKLYVRGTPKTKCSYAFLEHPSIAGAEGKLLIRARFNGKNGSSFLGLCLGLGDSFDLRIAALPYFADGAIRLKEVRVDTGGKETLYSNRVRAAIAADLTQKFSYQVTDEARKFLERKGANESYEQRLAKFAVSRIRITPEALVVDLDFTLIVK